MTTNPLEEIQARADAFAGRGTPGRNAPEDRAVLLKAIGAVMAVHSRAPVYDTWASDCGHDDCDGVELADGESYCPRSVVAYTCDHCADLARDNMNGELPAWPCPTIRAIREALG